MRLIAVKSTLAPHRLLILSIALSTLAMPPAAGAQGTHLPISWSTVFGQAGNDYVSDMAIDSHGNVVILAWMSGAGVYIVKYDAHGELWRVPINGIGVLASALALDSSDNIVVTGRFTGFMIVGPETLESAGSGDIFIASWTRDGTYRWGRRYGGIDDEACADVAIYPDGNIAITGSFVGTLDLGGGSMAADVVDAFVARFDPGMNHLWSASYRYATDHADRGERIALSSSGDIYVGMNSVWRVDSGFDVAEYHYGTLVRYDAGTHARHDLGLNGEVSDLFLDSSDEVVVVGEAWFNGSEASRELTFVSKFSTEGDARWTYNMLPLWGYCGAVDVYDNIFVGGYQTSPWWGNVVKLDPNGTLQWTQELNGTGTSDVDCIAIDLDGDIAVAGSFTKNVWLDIIHTSVGLEDAYLFRSPQTFFDFDPPGAPSNVSYADGVLTWNAPADPDIDHYEVWGSAQASFDEDARQFAEVATTSLDVSADPYAYYFVRAFDTSDNVGPFEAGIGVPDTDAPAAPGTLVYGSGTLTWAAPSDLDVDHYLVYGSADEALPAGTEPIGQSPERTFDATAYGYRYYFVAAVDRAGNEGEPARTMDNVAPAKVSGVTYDGVVVAWNASTDAGLATYRVYGTNSSQFERVLLGATHETSLDVRPTAYSTYSVTAIDNADNESEAATVNDGIAPTAPENLQLGAGVLSWGEVEGATYYDVYGSENSGLDAGDTGLGRTAERSFEVRSFPYPYYIVVAVDLAGNEGEPAALRVTASAYPLSVSAFPNPFNPNTTIRFELPGSGQASVIIFAPTGERVRTLFDGERGAGSYDVRWNGDSDTGDPVGSGIYFARLAHSSGTRTLKLVLVR